MISSDALRLLNLGPTVWVRTQSVYRATAELFSAPMQGAVILAQSLQPYVSYGRGQVAGEVWDLAACARLGWPLVERPVAGEAEYCDANQFLFQWVLPVGTDGHPIVTGVLGALNEFGIKAEYGAEQFTVNGARLGTLTPGVYGAAQVWLGCVYLEYDERPLARVGRAPRGGKTTSLWAEAPRPVAPENFQAAFIAHSAQAFGLSIQRDTPRVEETRRAKEMEMELLGATL